MKKKSFSLYERINCFRHAFSGIKVFILNEYNAKIHIVATIAAIILAIVCKIKFIEIILLSIVIGLVWICEMINTAIEKMMDFITIEKLPKIKFIKDVAAGAVFIAALVALITGCLIFIPKL